MLAKCANPTCTIPFRKLGSGRLFAFESGAITKFVDSNSSRTMSRTPVFFWLCEYCCLSFTFRIDFSGQLTLQRVLDGARVTSFGHPLDHVR
jgi:hypothetical protein